MPPTEQMSTEIVLTEMEMLHIQILFEIMHERMVVRIGILSVVEAVLVDYALMDLEIDRATSSSSPLHP